LDILSALVKENLSCGIIFDCDIPSLFNVDFISPLAIRKIMLAKNTASDKSMIARPILLAVALFVTTLFAKVKKLTMVMMGNAMTIILTIFFLKFIF
jgi:hypothetical protein